ncbi:LacI family transcriptional regulator [Rhodobacteraceae bacterium RKSG542]|uniref:LacI family DNA-binding transcriptional regulator n=1 Tax=Pseudovibrio flavus TaxID=2529854 RepID=UPI0012BB62EA|nr:substrate-binding domain-containing protein [Pseudovibrio flavus]MTI17086.1 LacI family transcriptional regulator [Pseudovibrio flavus]
MSLKKLAEHLGLSQTTVSRALNGYSDVSKETRERVSIAAKELGYRPNESARRLATGRSNIIGVAFPTDENKLVDPHFTEFLSGLAERAAEHDYDVLLSATKGDDWKGLKRVVSSRTVDLVVLPSVDVSGEQISLVKSLDIPFVVHGRVKDRNDYAFLDIDNYQVFYQPTKMLIDLGHKNIAILNGPRNRNYTNERLRGWQDALAEIGIEAPAGYDAHARMTEAEGFAMAMELLSRPDRPTALVCSSTLLASGAYRACSQLQLVVGRDVSITAHDDELPFLSAMSFDPPLAVTRSSIRAAGREVASIVNRYLLGESWQSLQTIWQAELVYRASVAPLKAS